MKDVIVGAEGTAAAILKVITTSDAALNRVPTPDCESVTVQLPTEINRTLPELETVQYEVFDDVYEIARPLFEEA